MKKKLFLAVFALLMGWAIPASAYDYSMSFDLTGKPGSDWSSISPTVSTAARTYDVAVNNTAGYLLVWGWKTGSQGVYTSSNHLAVRNLTKDAKVTLTLAESSQASNLALTENSDKITRVNDGNDIIFTVNDANVHIVELVASGDVVVTKLSLSLPIPAIYSYNLKGLAANAWKTISPTVVGNTRTYDVAVNKTDANMLVWGWTTGSGGVSASGNWMAVRNLSQGDVVDFTFAEGSSPSNVELYTNGDASQVTSSIDGQNLTATVVANRRMFEVTPSAAVTIENLSITRNKADLTNYIKNPIFIDADVTNNKLNALSGWSFTKSGNNSNIKSHVVEMWNNTFDINQNLTNLPNGYYTLSLKATSKDGKGELYATSDGETYTTALTKTSDGGNFDAIVTELNKSHGDAHRKSVNAFVSDGTMTIGVRQTEGHDANTWIVFTEFSLTYIEPTLSSVTKPLPVSGDMEAGVWYYYDITKAGEYSITASTLGNIIYSTDKNKRMSEADLLDDNFSATSDLLLTRYYVKSSTDNNLVFDANEKEYIVGDVTATSIADDAYIQELTTVTFTLGEANTNDGTATLEIQGSSTATLNDGSSDVAEGTLSIDAKVVTATFTSVTLDPSKTYTITLPANAIAWDKNTANKNSEKVITFKTPAVFDGYFFIKQNDADKYISRGGDDNTEAILDSYGIPVQLTTNAENVTRIKFLDTNQYLGGGSSQFWTDKAEAYEHNGFTITKSGDNYTFYLGSKEKYMKAGTTVAEYSDDSYAWTIEAPASHPAKLQAVKDAQAASAATAAGISASTQDALKTHLAANNGETPIAITGVTSVTEQYQQSAAKGTGTVRKYYSETKTGLKAGLYRVRVNAFERIASLNTVLDAGGAAGLAYVYANDQKVQLSTIAGVTKATVWSDGTPADISKTEGYYVNNTKSAGAAFDAGYYVNDVYIYLAEDGDIEFGIATTNCYGNNATDKVENSQWICYNNFSLVKFDAKPTDKEKTDLAGAISTAEGKTLGFEDGEYAPYSNVDALTKLAAAKAINTEVASREVVVAATTALTGASWTANDGAVDIVYNSDFSAGGWDPTGWTRTNGWGAKIPDYGGTTIETMKAAGASTGHAYYNQPGSMQYGNNGVYTMPLKANTIYTLTFKYASESANSNNSVTASVLNGEDGMAAIQYKKNGTKYDTENAFVTKTVKFVTGAAGNYVLTLANDGNTVMTDVSITKDANQYLEFVDGSAVPSYAPGTYPTVKITRTLTAGKWATAVYPFAVSGVDNIAVLDSYDSGTGVIGFTTAAASTANEPFLMRSTEGTSEISLSNVAVAATAEEPVVTKDEASLKGVYASGKVPESEGNDVRYVVSGNQLYKVDSDVNIKPFRAYFEFIGNKEARPVLRFDDTTAINAIEAAEAESGDLKDGKYLIDNKVVIVKNGVKYGANGQKLN